MGVRHVSVRYGGQHASLALDDVSFTLEPGVVHGLIGPNGSGKSTLIKVLAGLVEPSSDARLVMDGRDELALRLDPDRSASLGIRFVHQDRAFVPSLSVLENFYLGRSWPGRALRIDAATARRRLAEMLDVVETPLDADKPVTSLTDAQRVFLGLARSIGGLHGRSGFLVLDEPTAAMHPKEVERLFRIVRELAGTGKVGVVFVGHRLREVLDLADQITALADGRVVLEASASHVDEATLLRAFGAANGTKGGTGPAVPVARSDRQSRLVIHDLHGREIRGLSLRVDAGEIVGVTSLDSAPLQELAGILAGNVRPARGSLYCGALDVTAASSPQMRRAGIGIVPADRRLEGGVAALTIEENLFLSRTEICWEKGWFRRRSRHRLARQILEQYDVRPSEPARPFGTLSGGNQQKVLLARWMAVELPLLVLHEPTLGVDVGAREKIYELLRTRADDGEATLVISSDMEEMTTVCTRVMVVVGGRPGEELAGDALRPENLLAASFGFDHGDFTPSEKS